MTDEQRFNAIRARWVASRDKEHAYRFDVLLRKYAMAYPPSSWLTRGEIAHLDRFRRAQDRESTKFFVLLDRISPRNWHEFVPHAWVMEHLTWADAVTRGALSIVPPAGYGSRRSDVEAFAEGVR